MSPAATSSTFSMCFQHAVHVCYATPTQEQATNKTDDASSDIHSHTINICIQRMHLNKSINQSNVYSANIPGKARLSGSTAESIAKSRIQSTGHRACWHLWGKGQVKEMCLQIFLEGSNWNGWTDRQRQVVPKRRGTRVKSSSTSIVVWS